MWIVQLAIRRPYTFIAVAILILILGAVSIVRTPVDIFPNIYIPIINVVWSYTGLSPDEMSNRIAYSFERGFRPVIGGPIFATVATFLFVPVVSLLHNRGEQS